MCCKFLALNVEFLKVLKSRISKFFSQSREQFFIKFIYLFWEGHKIMRNRHQLFVLCTASQIIGGDFANFCGLLRIYVWTLTVGQNNFWNKILIIYFLQGPNTSSMSVFCWAKWVFANWAVLICYQQHFDKIPSNCNG